MTNRQERETAQPEWWGRARPIAYMTPLEDEYWVVHDENDEIIYILSNSGKPILATFRTPRPEIG